MRDHGADIAEASHRVWDTRKWLVSSEGTSVDQHIVEMRRGDERHGRRRERDAAPELSRDPRPVRHARLGAGPRAGPPGQRGADRGGGARAAHRATRARRWTRRTSSWAASRWRSRSTSPWATRRSSTGSSAGRPPSPARRGWSLAKLGSLRFGSELMNVTADATLPGALGSFGFDDEGTPAHPVDIVKRRHLGRAR